MKFDITPDWSSAVDVMCPDATGSVTVACAPTHPPRTPECPRDRTEPDGTPLPRLSQDSYEMFAIKRFGRGHVAAWADMSTLTNILGAIDLGHYLGRKTNPRVGSLGQGYPCELVGLLQPLGTVTFLGEELPKQYDDAAALARDWDVLVLCGGIAETSRHDDTTFGVRAQWATPIDAFVHDYGGGLLAVMDYVADNLAELGTPAHVFDAMNAITDPMGVHFLKVNLESAPTTPPPHSVWEPVLHVNATCVPDWP
jgi:hypothetical protein